VVLLSPPPLENLGKPWPDQTANNRRLAIYRDAIRGLAKARGHRFLDLYEAMGGTNLKLGQQSKEPLTKNGLHYEGAGYLVMAKALVEGLGLKLPSQLTAQHDLVAEVRSSVMEKNRLFFHRWRPANETYLFLFRKNEQGNNAKEIPMFDPLIKAEEKKISQRRAAVFSNLK
jgi:hypothetical protein